MRILYLLWDSYGTHGLLSALKERGDIVDTLPIDRTQDLRLNQELAEKLIRQIADKNYDMVFTYNYFPVVSLACNSCKVKYVSWVYDSPLITLYSNTIKFPYNYVFIFDKAAYYDICKYGVDTVYYMPLAADVKEYDSYIMEQKMHEVYDAPVSFVGSTYTERKNQLFRRFQDVKPYTRGYLEGVVQAQKNIYGAMLMEEMLTPDIMEDIESINPWVQNVDGFERASWVFAHYHLARHVTGIQRQEILEMLSDKFKVVLYTYEKTPSLPKVENRGPAGYRKEAAFIYRCSKINLNITLRSIISGIPLRAFEIMGSGGFLLSNYQEDFLEYFTPGEDFDYYTGNEDLMEKTEYYLSHEKERKEIARNGYEKMKKFHTYKNRIDEMMAIVCGDGC